MASKKSNKNPVNYPFKTKAQFAAELANSHEARCGAIVTLFQAMTAQEQGAGTAIESDRRGFMSSHSKTACAVAKKLIAGEELSSDEVAQVEKIAPCYTRQLASIARDAAKASDPALAEVGKTFGV
jgi:hypothetical protein